MSVAGGFAGKRVLITGGSSGIGLATAELLARKGAHLALLARGEERLEAAREAVGAARRDSGQEVRTIKADISDWEQVSSALRTLTEGGFVPDVLVNCAGVIEPGAFVDLPVESLREMMDIDYMGTVHVCKAMLPAMIERGSGHVVNVASVAGFIGIYGYGSYTPPKFAVMGLSEVLRCELKPQGLGVSVVCPPDTATPFLEYEVSKRPAETHAIAGNIKPVPPSAVAKALVSGVERGKYMIVVGAQSRLYYRLKGLVPSVFFAVFDSQVRKERRRAGGA